MRNKVLTREGVLTLSDFVVAALARSPATSMNFIDDFAFFGKASELFPVYHHQNFLPTLWRPQSLQHDI